MCIFYQLKKENKKKLFSTLLKSMDLSFPCSVYKILLDTTFQREKEGEVFISPMLCALILFG